MNGFHNNWSRKTNLFWFWLSAALAAGSLADIVYVYLFKNDGAEFWMAWAFWDRVIKVVMFSVFAWMYHGAAKNAEERGSVPAKR